MPLGSSSAAPVIKPGPRSFRIFTIRAGVLEEILPRFRRLALGPLPDLATGMAGSEALGLLGVAIAKLYFAAVASIWRSKNDGLQRLQLTTVSSLAEESLVLPPRMNPN